MIVVSVSCRSGVSGPRGRSHKDGFDRGEQCGHLGRCHFPDSFGPCLLCKIQRPLVPYHTGPIWIVMTHYQGTSMGLL